MKLPVFNISSIKNQSNDDVLDVFIEGDIVDAATQEIYRDWFGDDTSVSFKSLRESMNSTDAKRINIYINSGGGMMADAFAMHDFITDGISNGKNWHTYGTGIVASAATYPLISPLRAGKPENMHLSENCFVMIHNASGGVYGSVEEIESYANSIRKFNNAARDLYANCFSKPKETISTWMNAETWWQPSDMAKLGIIPEDCIGGPDNAIKNAIRADKWFFQNKAILNTINNSIKSPKNKSDMKLKKIGETVANSVKEALKNAGLIKDDKVGTINLADFETALTNGINTSIEELESEITTGITNGIAEGLKGDAFTTAVNNAVKEAMKTVPTNITEAITNSTKDLVNKTDLEKLKNDVADKLGTSSIRKTKNGAGKNEADKEDIAETEGITWNIHQD